ncbi:protein phosphatase 2C domain-containing protein [Streptomyces sp. NBC_00572]|uniref:protein phosphatase 2C domain-containing protein n=1 Tax=Streptomyces sp. NBC_00572 TaxID=2903664 RepID=UPI002255CCDE|nr:protein phosphatase 2C domain-containing protein [Streptomyces sp. NBC_00572]MCX4984240.1 protein phosphatase 2C domain-containing protein [Streptomyces sp. NBC_00572]
MTQQGDDNWWDKLYDESAPDTAPTASGDTLDDHFTTATRATTGPPTRESAPSASSGPAPVPDPRPAAQGPAAQGPAAQSPAAQSPDPTPAAPRRTPNPWGATAGPVPAPPPAPPGTGGPPHPVRAPSAPSAPPHPPAAQGPSSAPHAPPPAPAAPPAPWEVRQEGPQTFAAPPPPPPPPPAPPVEAPTVQVQVPPVPPRQDPESEPGPEPGFEDQDRTGSGSDAGLTVEVSVPRPRTGYVGSRPPTYEPEPTALPVARPGELGELVSDTVLDGARYGTCTLRAASVRGDSARYRGEPRRDALLTARFGHDETALVLVAVAAGSRAAEDAHLAAADACQWIAEAVCRSHARLSEDIRTGRRGDLKSGLHRLTDRTYGKLRTRAAERGLAPDEYTATLRCLLVPADPDCRTRVFFGIGGGGLFRLRDGSWQDIEPLLPEPAAVTGAPVLGFGSPSTTAAAEATEEGDRLTMDLGITTAPGPLVEEPVAPPAEPFRFRASVARPGDTLLLASPGLAEPMRGEPALARELAARWGDAEAPGLAAFLADTQLRVTGYADDRTGVGVWEA